MLLEEVGAKITDTGPESLEKALSALSSLHQAGLLHGSARLDNLLACGGAGGGYKWCDLQRAEQHDYDEAFRSKLREAMARKEIADEPEEKSKCNHFSMTSLHDVEHDVDSLLASFGQDYICYGFDLIKKYAAADFSLEGLIQLASAMGGAPTGNGDES